jgi:tRNA modification GTPase
LGIERTYHKLTEATVVLLVTDTQNPYSVVKSRIDKIRKRITNSQQLIIVANKIDAGKPETIEELENLKLRENEKRVFIVAREKQNLDELIDLMANAVNTDLLNQEDVIVTNARHFEILKNAHAAIDRVLNGLNTGITGDFLAQDIRECLHYLGEITGEITTDEVLGHIFKNFCIGK